LKRLSSLGASFRQGQSAGTLFKHPVLLISGLLPGALFAEPEVTGRIALEPRATSSLEEDPLVVPVVADGAGKARIGRGLDNDIVLPFGSVSRYHAVVSVEGAEFLISDVGSTNGSFLNGKQLCAHERNALEDDAFLMLGDVEMTFMLARTFVRKLLMK